MRARWMALVGSAAMLCVATVVVFMYFDAHSHSNSDTIRPFVITMAPAWILYVLVWRFVTVKRSKEPR
jgi:hypothetical protein